MVARLVWDDKPDPKAPSAQPLTVVERFRLNDDASPNLLVRGDNKDAMASLLPEVGGRIDLIYADPPFATGSDFSATTRLGGQEAAYRDTWGDGIDAYLTMMYERLSLMYQLLAPNGSFYLHLDSRVAHYLKVVCDEIFGAESFMREIVWRIGWISGFKAKAANWARNHDTILFYVKDRADFTFNKLYVEHDPNYRRGSYGSAELAEVAEATAGKPIDDVWVNLPSIQIMSFSKEKSGYPTQKNLDLLERIISASSNPGDLVADFFCGSGTTLVAAERLGRRWVGGDLGRLAVHTTRSRLLAEPGCSSFDLAETAPVEARAEPGTVRADVRTDGLWAQVVLTDGSVVTSWADLVDYWSVDFEYRGEVFDTKWWSHRTKPTADLELESGVHVYAGPGTYVVAVKVVGVAGDETTTLVDVEVGMAADVTRRSGGG